MEDNVMQKQEDMDELRKMLDTVANQKKDDIASKKEELNDIRKYQNITFYIEQNGEKVEVTKNIFEVITTKENERWHEFYDDQGNLLVKKITNKDFKNAKSLSELGEATFDKGTLMQGIISSENNKSLSELESEQTQEIADAVGIDKDTIRFLKIVKTNGKEKNESIDEKKKEAQEKLKQFIALGIEVDTRELATSDDTIKEALQVDANKLVIVQINGDWKALEIEEDGKLRIAKNLEVIDNKQPFNTIEEEGRIERRIPSIEFRRKDNPNISLAVDSNNKENKTQLYLIAGNSRTATELETEYSVSPYADAKNNELVQMAQEDPDKDPHEPDEPGERRPY